MIVPFENFNRKKASVNMLYAKEGVHIAHCRYDKPSEDEFFMPHAAITCVKQGRKVVFLNGYKHEMRAGDALYIPKNAIIYSDIAIRKEAFISVNMTLHNGEEGSPLAPLACRLTDSLPLKELAAEQYMSLSTFKRWFHRHTGASPLQWMIDKRLERARYLLQHKQRPVAEACFASGFQDVSYFIRRYKRRFGVTPGAPPGN